MQHERSPQERIIAAARHLFAIRGFHQTAVADLAKEADVSVGAIYRSYASKSDIIRAIIVADTEERLAEFQRETDRVRRGEIGIEAALEDIVRHNLCDKDDALTHEILAEAHRNPEVAASIGDFCANYRAILCELAQLAQPSLSDDELEGAGELILACLFGLAHRQFTRPTLDEAAIAKISTRQILRALGVPAAAA